MDPRECAAWRDVLGKIDDELIIWASTFKRKFGTAPERSVQNFGEEEPDSGERADTYAQSYENWDETGKERRPVAGVVGDQNPGQTKASPRSTAPLY